MTRLAKTLLLCLLAAVLGAGVGGIATSVVVEETLVWVGRRRPIIPYTPSPHGILAHSAEGGAVALSVLAAGAAALWMSRRDRA